MAEASSLFKMRQDAASTIAGLDVSASRTASEKAARLISTEIKRVEQKKQLDNPDAVVTLERMDEGVLLDIIADSFQGLKSGDDSRLRRVFWERQDNDKRWRRLQSTVTVTSPIGGLESIVDWQGDGQLMARRQGIGAWRRTGVAVSQMSTLPCALYFGDAFDSNVCPIIPKAPLHLPAIWTFCESGKYQEAIRIIDQKVAVANATLIVALARLLGYRWPAELELDSGSGFQPLDPANKRQDDASTMELSDEARLWVKKCEDLLPYADDDGIVCIPSVRGEEPAAVRLQALLAAAYGDEWSPTRLGELLAQVECADNSLDYWLREKFFEQHCDLFHQRPFIWHIWDGVKRDGFAALVNYHKLDRKLLETLTYNYLGDWIKRQEDGIKSGVDGAAERLDAARNLQHRLKLVLDGEAPYDIFVRWKPIEEQPIGWEPDLNDGVRLNIRPFVQAGVLRKNPRIHWNKDRGKDVEGSPWHHLFKGDRINDYHLPLAKKRAARERKEK